MNWTKIQDFFASTNMVSTYVLIVAVVLLRAVVLHWILRTPTITAPEIRRRWIVNLRNATLFLFVLGLIFVWGSELRTLALSLFAITAAIVLATKELILCITGSILRTTARSFQIGDRIEMGALRGDVIDISLLSTTILEIGPGQQSHQRTGRRITLPNALFLNQSVINESVLGPYVLHHLSIPLKMDDDLTRAETLLLEAAAAECQSYLEEARADMESLQKGLGVDAPSVDPRVTLQLVDPGRVNLLLRVPVPLRRKGRLEQAILKRYVTAWKTKPEGATTMKSA